MSSEVGDSASSGSGGVRHSVRQHQTSPECIFLFPFKKNKNKQAALHATCMDLALQELLIFGSFVVYESSPLKS